MINLRRADTRRHGRRHQGDVWRTFGTGDADPFADGFGVLEAVDEDRLAPHATIPQLPGNDTEIVTYVREGAVAYEDSIGGSGVIQAGEFQRLTSGRGLRHRESNASRTECAHVFQIRLRRSQVARESSREQKRFSTAARRGALCIVASPDARYESLRLYEDSLIYSALLERGQHIVHELSPERGAWLHVVHGEVTLDDLVLTTGDGAAVTSECAVSLTARNETELLLFDVVAPRPLACN